MICTKKVDMSKILTKTITIDEAPEVIRDIEKHPNHYMKVVVALGE